MSTIAPAKSGCWRVSLKLIRLTQVRRRFGSRNMLVQCNRPASATETRPTASLLCDWKGSGLGLNRVDLLIIAAYLAGITLFGLRFRKRQRTMRDYFLADRNIPWWAIALSIVAAETSTLTIISIPGLAYDSNLTFLQLVMGYVVGRVIISFVLLPQYFRGELYTAYQLIERRFGPELRTVTAALFLLTRAAAEGVRVYAVSIVVAIALGTGEVASVAIITLLTLIYTFGGGLAAVIWTNVVQTFIYVGGGLVGMVTILHLVPGGWGSVAAIAEGLHKFQVFDASVLTHWPYFNFAQPYTLWAGIIGGAFLTTASHGTDQLIVQRLLAARNQRQSVLALLSSGVAVFFQFGLFLVVGVMLFAYYRVPSATFGRAKKKAEAGARQRCWWTHSRRFWRRFI